MSGQYCNTVCTHCVWTTVHLCTLDIQIVSDYNTSVHLLYIMCSISSHLYTIETCCVWHVHICTYCVHCVHIMSDQYTSVVQSAHFVYTLYLISTICTHCVWTVHICPHSHTVCMISKTRVHLLYIFSWISAHMYMMCLACTHVYFVYT